MFLMHKRLIWLALIASLAGCATHAERKAKFTAQYDGYIGLTTDLLVQRHGVPTSTYTMSTGEKLLEYNRSSSYTGGGESYTRKVPAVVDGKTIYVNQGGTSPVGVWTAECIITFEASAQGIVQHWKSRGSACF